MYNNYNKKQNYNTNLSIEPMKNNNNSYKPKHKTTMFKRMSTLIVSSVLLGSIASGAFYGVGQILQNSDTNQNNYNSSLTSVSYTKTASSQSLDVSSIATEGLPSVVSVTNVSVQEVQSYFGKMGRNNRSAIEPKETTSCGSGVIIYSDESYIYMLTNYHVVQGATSLSVTFVDDKTSEAQVCGYDESTDVAVIKVAVSDVSSDTLSKISVVKIGDSNSLVVGEQVVAIGNALGYGQSVTTGIVSAVNRSISNNSTTETYIQTDAAINPGNSGGALLNMDGELIGINTAKISSTEVEGIGYAIPISSITDLIKSLIS